MSLERRRAQALIDRERFKEAKEEILKALTSDPEDALALAMLGWVTARLGRPHAAKAELVKAVQIKPDSGYVHRILALILLDLDDLKGAEAEAREAVRLAPRDVQAYGALASSLNRQRRWTLGLQAAESGLEIDPNHVNCGIYRVRALIHLDRIPEADTAAQASLTENSESPYTQIAAGLACYHDGDMLDAFLHYREALRLAPDSAAARLGALRSLRANYPLHRAGRAIDGFLDRVAKTRYGKTFLVSPFALLGALTAHLMVAGSFERTTACIIMGLFLAIVLACSLDGPMLYMQMLGDREGIRLLTPQQKLEGMCLAGLVGASAFSSLAARLGHSRLDFGAIGFIAFLSVALISRLPRLANKPKINTLIAGAAALIIFAGGVGGLAHRY